MSGKKDEEVVAMSNRESEEMDDESKEELAITIKPCRTNSRRKVVYSSEEEDEIEVKSVVEIENMNGNEKDNQGMNEEKEIEDEQEENKEEWVKMTPRQKKKEHENVSSIDSEATNLTNNKNNTKSTNPRAKKQLQMPIEIQSNHRIIYSLKLFVNKLQNPMKTMQSVLREWFKEMRKCSPSFVVYKWKEETFSQAITCTETITANVYQMKQYFSGIRPKVDGRHMWATIHAGHDEVYEAIKDNTSWWLAKTDSGLYKKNLQFHDTVKPICCYGHMRGWTIMR